MSDVAADQSNKAMCERLNGECLIKGYGLGLVSATDICFNWLRSGEVKLRVGELSAGEARVARAVVNGILADIQKVKP